MRGLTGLTFILAGGAIALYSYLPTSSDREQALNEMLGSAPNSSQAGTPTTADANAAGTKSGNADALVVIDPQRRMFSPQSPLFQQQPAPQAAPGNDRTADQPVKTVATAPNKSEGEAKAGPVRTIPNGSAATAAAPIVNAPPVTSPIAADVKPTQKSLEAVGSSLARPLVSPKAGSDDAKRDLTNNIQKELARVGCYQGDVDGTWNAATKRAMKSFTDRVNATLPVEDPDYILLTLVQGHAGEACGRTCPADQGLNSDGRCMPKAIIAQAAKKAARPETAAKPDRAKRTVEKADAEPAKVANANTSVKPAVDGKANKTEPQVAGQIAGQTKQGPGAADNSAWKTTTTAAARPAANAAGSTKVAAGTAAATVAPAAGNDSPGNGPGTSKAVAIAAVTPDALAASALPSSAPAAEPLPGRMSVGGPIAPAASPAPAPAPALDAGTAAAAAEATDAATAPRKSNGANGLNDPNGSYSANGSNGTNGSSKSSPEPAAEPKKAPRKVAGNWQPRPQRYVPPYYVGAIAAPRPYRVPKSVRVQSMHYNLFTRPDRSTN